jgi:hypothetical protein
MNEWAEAFCDVSDGVFAYLWHHGKLPIRSTHYTWEDALQAIRCALGFRLATI